MFGEIDAYLLHSHQFVEHEVDTRVGQRGIAHSWTYALELLAQQLVDGELFIGSITPPMASHLKVHLLDRGLSQPVGEGLRQQPLVLVVGVFLLHGGIDGDGEHPHPVGHTLGARTNEVGERQAHALSVRPLLAEHGQSSLSQPDIITLGIGIEELEYGMRMIASFPIIDQLKRFLAQSLARFPGFAVHLPRMEEIQPVDIVDHL